jgi:hypothetical protein
MALAVCEDVVVVRLSEGGRQNYGTITKARYRCFRNCFYCQCNHAGSIVGVFMYKECLSVRGGMREIMA